MQTLNDLRELHLENNAISRIEGLENNKNLQVLNLANNRIEVKPIKRRKLKILSI
jgi:Leucine-rich repeat (LRR) protein